MIRHRSSVRLHPDPSAPDFSQIGRRPQVEIASGRRLLSAWGQYGWISSVWRNAPRCHRRRCSLFPQNPRIVDARCGSVVLAVWLRQSAIAWVVPQIDPASVRLGAHALTWVLRPFWDACAPSGEKYPCHGQWPWSFAFVPDAADEFRKSCL